MGAREKDEWTARMKGLKVNLLVLTPPVGSGDNQSIRKRRSTTPFEISTLSIAARRPAI
jgi:hypothetical protein